MATPETRDEQLTDPEGTSSADQPSAPTLWVVLVAAGLLLGTAAAVAAVVGVARGPATEDVAVPVPSVPVVADPRPTPSQAAAGASGLLAWAPPELVDPERIEITADNRFLDLDPERDYELVLPEEPLVVPGGVTVSGGHNVVMIGGEIRIPEGVDSSGREVRAVALKDQTGTVHVEGVAITGPGLGEGFNLDQQEGAVVQLQNIYLDTVQGTQEGHHADLVQTWAGPRELRIDGLTGSTNYQGFFLLPQQFGDQPEPEVFDLRRIDITGVEGSGYMLWRDDAGWPVRTQDVWVSSQADPEDRGAFLWPRDDPQAWADVQVGSPPQGSFVPEGTAGVGYRSPGYGSDG